MSEQRHEPLALHPLDDDEHPVDAEGLLRRRQILRRTRLAALAVLLLLGLGAGRTLIVRAADTQALQQRTAAQAATYVKVARPRSDPGGAALVLPGTLQGQQQSPIAARASGYLKRWTRDIGSRVAAGELLAEIDTPEIDQQLQQAVAAREQAAAALQLAKSTVERWEGLRRQDVVSQQELDERRSAAAQAQANLAAAEANVQRLKQTEAFKRVLAPFAGVVTRRNVEVGDLIDAGGGAARALFVLTQTDPLRVSVQVPQAQAVRIRPGQAVTVAQAELPGRRFAGRVARTAGALDPATRTLQVEMQLPNPDGELLPGAYVQVRLELPAAGASASGASASAVTPVRRVPPNVLLFRAEGVRVGVVDAQGRVSLRAVTLGRNLGAEVEVLGGLKGDERLVLNPGDSLADGDAVVVVEDKPAAAAGAPSTPAAAASRP